MPAGRPSKYDPAMCEIVETQLAKGLSLTAACAGLHVVRDTAYEWMAQHQEFSDAVKRGRAKGQELWEETLRSQALENPGNTAAIIFAMKNLYRDDWKDRQTVEGDNENPVQHKMTVEFVDNRNTSTDPETV